MNEVNQHSPADRLVSHTENRTMCVFNIWTFRRNVNNGCHIWNRSENFKTLQIFTQRRKNMRKNFLFAKRIRFKLALFVDEQLKCADCLRLRLDYTKYITIKVSYLNRGKITFKMNNASSLIQFKSIPNTSFVEWTHDAYQLMRSHLHYHDKIIIITCEGNVTHDKIKIQVSRGGFTLGDIIIRRVHCTRWQCKWNVHRAQCSSWNCQDAIHRSFYKEDNKFRSKRIFHPNNMQVLRHRECLPQSVRWLVYVAAFPSALKTVTIFFSLLICLFVRCLIWDFTFGINCVWLCVVKLVFVFSSNNLSSCVKPNERLYVEVRQALKTRIMLENTRRKTVRSQKTYINWKEQQHEQIQ